MESLVELALRAFADAYYEKAPDDLPKEGDLRAMVEDATRGMKGHAGLDPERLEAMVQAIRSRPLGGSGFEVSRRQVARWFEIPDDEFEVTPISALRPDVLFRHVYYEDRIASWFREWGYSVKEGEELEGLEGADFVPDVYAELETLHGSFQVAVTLFCQQANTYRVLGMFENIEAFAPKGSEFGERDIYLLVTPYKFLEQATNHIRVQAHQEDYFVVPVEGNDLHDLEHAPDSSGRKERLQDLVMSVSRRKVF
ncbi:MAG: hypothetical protein ACTHM1_03490 [Solirubrobacteraceae bacterium]